MPVTEPINEPKREITFGDNGEELASTELEGSSLESEEPAESAEPEGKYRIGEQTFKTLAEAHAYATAQVQQTNEVDAYRQVISEALRTPGSAIPVTPVAEAPAIDEEKLWSNPSEFLKNFAHQIKSQTLQEVNQQTSSREAGDAIWREFVDRHPNLSDFRQETEAFATNNQPEIQALIKAKGRKAGYDYIALRLREQFARYADATKPQRQLPNVGTGTSPSQRGTSVTPPKATKKPLSFAEQIRSIKRKR